MEIDALYERQFMVRVQSQYGVSGDGWYSEGSVASIQVPENPSGIVFLKKRFNGFDGYPGSGATLDVPVNGPTTISATYHTSVNVWTLILAVGALVAIGLVYFITQREYNRRKRRPTW